ncbi:hypothetical protein [Crateriforma conspicua]|uniref:Uncharacterized protein n=1 Tax=Crateriforma conspicua TaxID=2527996 RepID=A0A5C5XZL8_9PLAN|nr:hypothetical protein [Crateriforma conspicua]QDV63346.1 hypothetical protein Mal65_24880 [Crateriforma conspicua]TWT67881.1 hypothetical protein Pan14r_01190 [Crateriforma conspicua]
MTPHRSPSADRQRKAGLTHKKLLGFVVSAVVTLGSLMWIVSLSSRIVDHQSNDVDARDVSYAPGDPEFDRLSRSEKVEALRREAARIDEDLMWRRSYRLRERRRRNQPGTYEVHESWKREVENLEKQVKAFPNPVPGSIGWDVRERLKELKADPALNSSDRESLRD